MGFGDVDRVGGGVVGGVKSIVWSPECSVEGCGVGRVESGILSSGMWCRQCRVGTVE